MFSANAETKEIFLYDEIGPAWWGLIDETTVINALEPMKGSRVTVRINTPGGSVDSGVAIYNALKRHPGGVDTVVDALAASMGSYIFLAGENRVIAKNARLMVHQPWTIAFGNAKELRKTADILDKYSTSLVDDYANALALSVEETNAILEEETWYTAQEAVDAGLAMSIGLEVVTDPPIIPEGRFKNTPTAILTTAKAGTRNSAKNWDAKIRIAAKKYS